MTKLDKKEEQTLEENLSEEKLNDSNSDEKPIDEKLNDVRRPNNCLYNFASKLS